MRASSRSRASPATASHPICAPSRGSSTSAASSSSRATSSRPEQVAELAREAQSLARELPLWVSVDQEGGRVARLKVAVHRCGRRCMTLGRSGDEELAERFARALAAELRAVGISLDFTPVLDILTNPKNPVIGDRALAERRRRTSRGSARSSSRRCRAKASPPAASTFPVTATPASTRITRCRSSSIRPTGSRRWSSSRSGPRSTPVSPAS